MARYINAENIRYRNGTTAPEADYVTRSDIAKIPEATLADILENYTICGYSFDELMVFADACKRMEIHDEDLKEFIGKTKSAIDYVFDLMAKQVMKDVAGGLEN